MASKTGLLRQTKEIRSTESFYHISDIGERFAANAALIVPREEMIAVNPLRK